ncbi:hypothetical protein KHQ06_37565 [Nocardia tengchongensis]|uniref:DUF6875 domain-containing protein n=1 Tax=Nocardia tengchongensis TaxID=2055889 RepID=A0ABX8CNS8_9NOCA|nr:hypothetical protein [Nocardia tengchongensis]QVI21560.1 hypothetical protein KHQ06_37565 [Nocardia tengchongensis]
MNSDRIVGTRSGVEPVNLFDPDIAAADGWYPRADELRRWMVEYLCRTHPDLGRPGAVCPYTSHAITLQSLWAAFIKGRDIDRGHIAAIVADLYDLFPSLPPRNEPDSRLKAVLAVFPDLTEYADIEAVQREQKTRFVEQGLMLGQFYPGCTVAGLHNPSFHALDAPLPMLAIRYMAPTDFPFLSSRHEWMDFYLHNFAPEIPKFIATTMSDMLVQDPDAPPE